MHIVYFITGHGYGHAIRSVTIVANFSTETRVTFVSTVPESFFRRELYRPFALLSRRLDCGCLQSDFITVDVGRTLACYTEIAIVNQRQCREMVSWCKRHHVDGIVSDIVPCAFEIAQQCNIPSLAATNFTWFDVYREYVSAHPNFSVELEKIQTQYQSAGKLLAMSPALPMSYFTSIEPLPVIGRKGINRKEELHRHFGTSPDKNIAIIYIGDFGLSGATWNQLESFASWEFFGLQTIPGTPRNYHLVDPVRFSYPDMIASADCIFGKLGYGLVAEAMINGTPLIFLPRNNFAEYPFLERSVTLWGGGIKLSVKVFTDLDWGNALEQAVKILPPQVPAHGAAMCAKRIESYFS